MFCKFCGSELPDNMNFCGKCGKLQDSLHPQQEGDVVVQPIICKEDSATWNAEATAKQTYSKGVLTYSIWGLALGATGFLSVVGLVLSGIARYKLSKYREMYGPVEGRAKIGKHLSMAGIIVSLVAIAIFIATAFGGLGNWLAQFAA